MNYQCVGLLCLFILCPTPNHPVHVDDDGDDDVDDDGDDNVGGADDGDGDAGGIDDNDGGAVIIEMW